MASFVHLLDQRRLIGPGGSTISGEIYFYYTGTTVKAPVYQDSGLSIPSDNPISVAAGEVMPTLYLDDSISYRRVIEYSDGTSDQQDPLGSIFTESEVGLPVGSIIDYSGPTAPDGFLFCYGQALSRTLYSELFTAIGTTYGSGDGSTTFNIPDFRGRVGAGKDNMGGSAAGRISSSFGGEILGATGGFDTHTLLSSEMPTHKHTLNDPGHTHTYHDVVTPSGTYFDSGTGSVSSTRNTGSSTTGITMNNTGGNAAHNNTQPTIIVNKIIKVSPISFLSLLGLGADFSGKANASAVGIGTSDTSLGSFTGTTIDDNSTVKEALQDLETAFETSDNAYTLKANASAMGVSGSDANMGTFTGSTITDGSTAKVALQDLETAHEKLQSAASGEGAELVTYRPDLATTYITRGVGDKLDENRSILDFLPFAQHADIKDGISTWDASTSINAGIADVGGRHIDLTPARLISIESPIKLVRGTFLHSKNSTDTQTGNASIIKIADGADCAAIQTETAWNSVASTHYYGLDGLFIEGNAGNQTTSVSGGLVQMYGAWIGSHLTRCKIANSRGPSLVLGLGPNMAPSGGGEVYVGSDLYINDLWINAPVLAAGEYAVDTNMHAYANGTGTDLNSLGDYSTSRSGLLEIGFMFVENPKAAFGDVPRDDYAKRTRNAVRFHALEAVKARYLHVESCIKGVTLTNNRSVEINSVNGAWVGDNGTSSDEGLVAIGDGNFQITVDRTYTYSGVGGIPAAGYPFSLLSGATDTNDSIIPPINPSGYPAGPSLNYTNQNCTPNYLGRPRFTNYSFVVKHGSVNNPGYRVGFAADNVDQYGSLYTNGGQVHIGSTDTDTTSLNSFITLNPTATASSTNRRILFNEPILPCVRTSLAGVDNRSVLWTGSTAATQYLYAKTPNSLDAAIPLVTTNAGSPVGSVTPIAAGKHMVYDSTGGDWYGSTGATSSDWKKFTP